MAKGKVFHLRLHQGEALKYLQKWFSEAHQKYLGLPAREPTAATVIDHCLKAEVERLKPSSGVYRVTMEQIEAEAVELAMCLYEQNLPRLLKELGHSVSETYRTEGGQGLAAKIGPFTGNLSGDALIMEVVDKKQIDWSEVRAGIKLRAQAEKGPLN